MFRNSTSFWVYLGWYGAMLFFFFCLFVLHCLSSTLKKKEEECVPILQHSNLEVILQLENTA